MKNNPLLFAYIGPNSKKVTNLNENIAHEMLILSI